MKSVILFFLIAFYNVNSLKLEEVFILSRHNLRTPLLKTLQSYTSYLLPTWEEPAGDLTEKGMVLEEFMGEFFIEWLKNEGLFTDECPRKDSVYMYTNTKHRTKETGKAFLKGAFKNCNINVHYKDIDDFDPIFNPSIKNTTDTFKKLYTSSMEVKLNSLRLKESYLELEKIIDLKHSDSCEDKSFCDLVNTKDEILYEIGQEPDINGPLSIGNAFVDVFLMSYYNGMLNDDVAWGKITKEEQWQKLLQITRENQNVRFNHSLAKDTSKPLLNYIKTSFVNKIPGRIMTILVGHDSNLNSVMAALEFKNYVLTGQYELLPIGGKLVFQRWSDDDDNYFLKINYVYQSTDQIKNTIKLSLHEPPQNVVMEMKHCEVDENGFCSWYDFVNIMNKI